MTTTQLNGTAHAGDQEALDRLLGDFEAAYSNASDARARIHEVGAAMLARTVRGVFPTATGMSVNVRDLALVAVLSGDGSTLWQDSGPQLPPATAGDVSAYLTDVLTFGTDPEVLADFGWVQATHRSEVFTVAFPESPASPAAP